MNQAVLQKKACPIDQLGFLHHIDLPGLPGENKQARKEGLEAFQGRLNSIANQIRRRLGSH